VVPAVSRSEIEKGLMKGHRTLNRAASAAAAIALVAIVKKQLHLDASLYSLLQILSATIFERMPLQQAVTENAHPSNNLVNPNQLNLRGV